MARQPKSGEPKKLGRPSKFTADIAEEICSRLSKGEPLAVICRDDHMPSDETVRNWTKADRDFSSAIAHAREVGFDMIAAECLAIADQPNKRITVDGEAHESDAARDRLRVETRLKLLAKWDPKRYGEKLAHVGGGDGDEPIKTELKVSFVG